MTERWRARVDEHRDGIERWATSDLPLAEEMAQLLAEAEYAAAQGVTA